MEGTQSQEIPHESPHVEPKTPTSGPPKVTAESFTKIKLIGKGDVGKVYLVRHNESGKLYAMKMLSKQEMIKRNKVYWCISDPKGEKSANRARDSCHV